MSEIEFRPGLEDVPAAKSAISFIDGKKSRLEYRGFPVDVLAKESRFEETAWLLLKGDLPTQKQLADFDHDMRQRRAIHFRLKDSDKTPFCSAGRSSANAALGNAANAAPASNTLTR